MARKNLLIPVLLIIVVQQQFQIALANDRKSSIGPVQLADVSCGPYRSDAAPKYNLAKDDDPHEFATELKLIIAQSDFEKHYGSYGARTISICNLDKSDDPQIFEAELNKIVAQSDFEKHLINKAISEPTSRIDCSLGPNDTKSKDSKILLPPTLEHK